MTSQIEMDPSMKCSLKASDLAQTVVTVRGVPYTLLQPLGVGKTGVTWKCKNDLAEEYAIKFVSLSAYQDVSYLPEVARARRLRYCSYIARLEGWGEPDPYPVALPKGVVCFVVEYVDGDTLSQFLHKTEVTPRALRSFVDCVGRALAAMKREDLHHNDMHDGNIMVRAPTLDALGRQERIVKVIDTGSLRASNRPVSHGLDDHTQFATHIMDFFNRIRDTWWRLCTADRRYLKRVRQLLDLMFEENTQRRLELPDQILQSYSTAYAQSLYEGLTEQSRQLTTPFDYISAEHIANDELLSDISSTKCPWYQTVASPDPVCLTGPRGCGKSTVLRLHRLRTLLNVPETDFSKVRFVGFYLSCSATLRTRYAYIKRDDARKLEREIVHFFNLQYLREIIDTFRLIPGRDDASAVFGWSEAFERAFHDQVLNLIGRKEASSERLHGARYIDHLLDVVDREIELAYRSILTRRPAPRWTPPSLLADVTRLLRAKLPFFRARTILLLVDDYSIHRIPKHIQRILNLVIWDRQDSHVFKLSAEILGVERGDVLGGMAVEGREIVEIDCGASFLNLSRQSDAHAFIEDVLARRFKAAGYSQTPRELLGRTQHPDGLSLAAALKTAAEARRRKARFPPVYYHGLECIADLCSGDISTILDAVRRIFYEGRVDPKRTTPIPQAVQHRAIVRFSRDVYESIRTLVPLGTQMQSIVHEFGQASRSLLETRKNVSKGGRRTEPYRLLRVEVDDPPRTYDELGQAAVTLRELRRRAVLIEVGPGSSRRDVVCQRLQLRRIYCPTFLIPLSHSEPLIITKEQLRFMLTNPKQFFEMIVASKTEKGGPKAWTIPLLPVREEDDGLFEAD